MKRLALAALAAVWVGGANPAAAVDWNMASGYGDAFFHTKLIEAFIADVDKSSQGKLTIKLHKNQSLFKLPDIKRAVQTEQVQIGEILLSQFGNEEPLYELNDIPFLADSFDAAAKLWTALRPPVDDSFKAKGMRVLYVAPWPTSGFYSNKNVDGVKDLKGAKIRVYNDITRAFFTATESNPALVQFSEVPQAFATGLVDVMFTAPQLCLALKCWDFIKQFKHVGSHVPTNAVIVSEKAFAALDQATQKALLDAGKRADAEAWKTARTATAEQLETLRKNGMTVTEANPAFMAELRKVGAKTLEDWLKKAGPKGQEVVKTYRGQF